MYGRLGQEERLDPAFVCGEIGLVQSLGIEGIPVLAGSEFPDNVALWSRYRQKAFLLPPYSSDEFIVRLLEIGNSLSYRPVLLTDDDQALLAISRNREALRENFRFLLPDPEVVEHIHDKGKFYEIAESYGLPIPDSYIVSSKEELFEIHNELTFPCIVKPSDTGHWKKGDFSRHVGPYKKAIRCTDQEELGLVYSRISQVHPKVVLQESVEGEDHRHFSINMYIDREGNLQGYYIYQKMRMYPVGAGRGTFFVTIHDKKILKNAQLTVEKFNMRGLVNIQYKEDSRTGDLKLIEIEPRLSISSFLGPASGMNLAARYYYDLAGEKVKQSRAFVNSYQTGVKYSDPFIDLKAFVAYWRDKKMSLWEWAKSYRGKCVYNGYLLSDPRPVLQSIWLIFRRRLNGEKKENVPHRKSRQPEI